MRIFRSILGVFAFVAVCVAGPAWAADAAESAGVVESVQVAQSQDGAHLGDNRPATLGDIRHFESRMEARMDEREARMEARMDAQESRMDERMNRMESRMDARIERLEDRMIQMFLALLTLMIALFGFPHLPDWWNRLRAGGKPAVVAGVLMFALALAGVVVAASI